jgi:hypothetical protein
MPFSPLTHGDVLAKSTDKVSPLQVSMTIITMALPNEKSRGFKPWTEPSLSTDGQM